MFDVVIKEFLTIWTSNVMHFKSWMIGGQEEVNVKTIKGFYRRIGFMNNLTFDFDREVCICGIWKFPG